MAAQTKNNRKLLQTPIIASFTTEKLLDDLCRKEAFNQGISFSNWMRDAARRKLKSKKVGAR